MSRAIGVFFASLVLGGALSGCTALKTLAEAQQMEREIRQHRIKHYKYIGDVYFVLGLDYYGLAKDAEARNEKEKAEEYARKAKLYHYIYREMDREVKRLSQELGWKDELETSIQAIPASP